MIPETEQNSRRGFADRISRSTPQGIAIERMVQERNGPYSSQNQDLPTPLANLPNTVTHEKWQIHARFAKSHYVHAWMHSKS